MLQLERLPFKRREVSVVPLIDVIFQLLIFFLMAGTIQKLDALPIELPLAESGKVVDEGSIVILLGKSGEIQINDKKVDISEIIPEVSDKLAHFPLLTITLKADQGLKAKQLIEVMEYVQAAGGQNISLVTQGKFE